MEAILQSQIFFFITSIAVIILTILLVVIGFYVLKIVRNVSEMSEIAKETVFNTSERLGEINQKIKTNSIYRLLVRLFKKTEKSKVKNRD